MFETRRLIEMLALYFDKYSGMAAFVVGKEQIKKVDSQLRKAWVECFPDRPYPTSR